MKKLGRGLGSLFSEYDEYDESAVSNVPEDAKNIVNDTIEVKIGLIDNNPDQPRKNFDEKALNELAVSIKNYGIIQPLVLNSNGDRYVIVAGERRFRAAKIAGLKTVPAVIKHYDERQVKEIAIIENLQREDLNPIEAAVSIKELIEKYDLTQDEVADKIGKSRPAVTNTIRLLSLPESVVEMVRSGQLSAGHARAILSIEDDKLKLEVAKLACNNNLSVREIEKFVKNYKNPVSKKEIKPQSLEIKEILKNLQTKFSTKVKILGDEHKGKLVIDYYNMDDLERIIKLLK